MAVRSLLEDCPQDDLVGRELNQELKKLDRELMKNAEEVGGVADNVRTIYYNLKRSDIDVKDDYSAEGYAHPGNRGSHPQ
jgi:hypothetical protein